MLSRDLDTNLFGVGGKRNKTMKTISSKLNIYARSINIINGNIERLILNSIIFSFILCAFLYVLFLGNMVNNIVERRSFEADARILSSEVRDLEVVFLSMSNNIDLTLSHSLGFQETNTTFATRKSLGLGQNFDNLKTVSNGL